jgi:hypothetical protein
MNEREAIRSQAQSILGDLQAGLTITPLEALNRYGCFRLAAVIHKLRRAGHMIATEDGVSPDGKHFARYRMVHPAAEQPSFDFLTTEELLERRA